MFIANKSVVKCLNWNLVCWFFSVNCLIIDISMRYQSKRKIEHKIHIKHVWFSYQHRRKIVYNYFHLKTCTKFSHSVCSLKNFVVFCVFHLKNFFFVILSLYVLFFSESEFFFSSPYISFYFIFFIKAFIFYKILPQKHVLRYRNSMNRNDEKHISCLLI